MGPRSLAAVGAGMLLMAGLAPGWPGSAGAQRGARIGRPRYECKNVHGLLSEQ